MTRLVLRLLADVTGAKQALEESMNSMSKNNAELTSAKAELRKAYSEMTLERDTLKKQLEVKAQAA